MLPFLSSKKNQQTGVIIKERQEIAKPEAQSEETELVDILIDALTAYKSRDIKTLALLIRELHDCLHKFMDKPADSSYEPAARE